MSRYKTIKLPFTLLYYRVVALELHSTVYFKLANMPILVWNGDFLVQDFCAFLIFRIMLPTLFASFQFTTNSTTRELVPGGSKIKVTKKNAPELVR